MCAFSDELRLPTACTGALCTVGSDPTTMAWGGDLLVPHLWASTPIASLLRAGSHRSICTSQQATAFRKHAWSRRASAMTPAEKIVIVVRPLGLARSRIFVRPASVSRNRCGGVLRLQGQPGPNVHELMNCPLTLPPSGARIPSTSRGRHARSWCDRRRCTNLSAAQRSPLAMHRSC